MFVLTPGEQSLVVFAVLALVLGAWFQHYRDVHLNDVPAHTSERSITPSGSPTPDSR